MLPRGRIEGLNGIFPAALRQQRLADAGTGVLFATLVYVLAPLPLMPLSI